MILASAKKILLEGSYHNFSMRNVAKDCGIGVGTIAAAFLTGPLSGVYITLLRRHIRFI